MFDHTHHSLMMYSPAQEMGLFNAAYDGDVESLNCALETQVPADFVSPVRHLL